MIRQFLLSSL